MKKNVIIYAAWAIGVAAVFYFLKRKKKTATVDRQQPLQQSRHLTDVFSKAKQSNLPVV